MTQFLQHTLSNGLEIVAECNSQAHSAAFGFFVQTGARDESDQLAGVSHFLEHMAFKGTERHAADEVNRKFDEMGAHYNAFTSEENTVYYATVLPEFQQSCIDLLADIMRPVLREEDFQTEKKVIVEEIKMYEDQPPFGADEKCKAAFFGAHPLGRSVLGTEDSILDLTVKQMRDYFQGRYSPGNMVVAAAGHIDFEKLTAQIEESCGNWSFIETTREVAHTTGQAGFELISREEATQQYIMQMSDGPGSQDEDRFAAKLLATVVGDDSGSRMYWELVDPGLADHASLAHYEYEGQGLFMGYLACTPELAVGNLQRMMRIFQKIEQEGPSDDELDQAKNKVRSRIVLSGERPRNRLFSVGGNWISRREYRTVKDDLDKLAAIRKEELIVVLTKYPLSVNTTMTIGPLTAMAGAKRV